MFHLLILESRIRATENILFDGNATCVLLPGAEGEFEILDFHKPIVSRLKKGVILVDNAKEFLIEGGVAKMSHQNLVAVVEL
jgi:F-type H+-transporting ATPase subunit epsilon